MEEGPVPSSTRAHPPKVIRPLRGGQITIPAEFRRRMGITDDSLLQVTLANGELRIKPVRVQETGEGSAWLADLYERFAPVRDEAQRYTEQEIDEAIMAAVTAVRNDRD